MPTLLRDLCAGARRLELPAATLDQLLRAADERCRGFYGRVVESGTIRPELAISIDGEAQSFPLHERLAPNAEVAIIPAIGGGCWRGDFASG